MLLQVRVPSLPCLLINLLGRVQTFWRYVRTAAAGGDKGYEKRAGGIWLYKLQSGRMVLVSLPTYISAFSAARALGMG